MPRKSKSDKPTKAFTSDRSWAGKNILTGEDVAPKNEGTMGRNWKTAEFRTTWDEERQIQVGICFRDGKEIARFDIKPDPKKRRF